MRAHRIRWGAAAWLLTLQFFLVETVVQAAWPGSYSRADELISALGAAASPAAPLMNASFVAQGALIAAGALLLRPVLGGEGGRLAPVLLGAAAVGVVLVGLVPQDTRAGLHQAGAGLYLVGGGLGLVALAYALRRRSEALGTALALGGVVAVAMTVFFAAGITAWLGEGGTERAAAYVLPVGLAVAGAALWRRPGEPGPGAQDRSRPREEDRDAALDAPATRAVPAHPDDEEGGDPGDPWSRRR